MSDTGLTPPSELEPDAQLYLPCVLGGRRPAERRRREIPIGVVAIDAVGEVERFGQQLERGRADAEAPGDAHVERRVARAAAGVSRQIAAARARIDEACAIQHVRRPRPRAGREIGTVVGQRVPVVVAAGRDVERRPAANRQDAPCLELPRQIERAVQHEAVALVEFAVAVPIVGRQVVLIGRRIFSVVGRFVARKRVGETRLSDARPTRQADEQRVIVAEAARFEHADRPFARVPPDAGRRHHGVRFHDADKFPAPGVHVIGAHRQPGSKRVLHADRRIVRTRQRLVRLRDVRCRQRAGGHAAAERIRIAGRGDHENALRTEPVRQQRDVEHRVAVEDAVAAADGRSSRAERIPCHAKPRRERCLLQVEAAHRPAVVPHAGIHSDAVR